MLVVVITTTMGWTPGTASTVPDSYAFGKWVVRMSDPFGNLGHRSVTMIQNPNVHFEWISQSLVRFSSTNITHFKFFDAEGISRSW